MSDLTAGSEALLLDLGNDKENWGGEPLSEWVPFGGNVGFGPAAKGHLTDLKKKGYVTTDEDEGVSWVSFTTKAHTALETIDNPNQEGA